MNEQMIQALPTTGAEIETKSGFGILPVAFAALFGLGIVVMAGHVQAAALHDAAHDVRHATGFPCH